MDYLSIIERYYGRDTDAARLLIKHSRQVADLAMDIAARKPQLEIDVRFVYEAAMLHDIGIYLTDAPEICCNGVEPYIKHGLLGRELLDSLGFPRHTLVCERHTGAGLSKLDIIDQHLPLPVRDMLPVTVEEKLVCYADKFYSKSHPDRTATYEQARKKLGKYGEDTVARFDALHELFG